MPRMQGAAVQCCMCITGVFMFLGGVVMLATGICLILNYGLFDEELLSSEMQTEDGKKTVGIILSACGFCAMVVSVLVSTLYLCNKHKPSQINPDDLSRIPSSARHSLDKHYRPRISSGASSMTGSTKLFPVPNGHSVSASSHTKSSQKKKSLVSTPGSAIVKLPRQAYKKRGRHKKKFNKRGLLEEIKEADAISRKTLDGALPSSRDMNDTPRSGSASSEQTIDGYKRTVPRLVFGLYEEAASSVDDSCSTSMTSDTSNYRSMDADKSRRELQFMSAARLNEFQKTSEPSFKDSVSIDRDDLSYVVSYTNKLTDEEQSFTSETSKFPPSQQSTSSMSRDADDKSSAGGNSESSRIAQSSLPGSDESVLSYRAALVTTASGANTAGRVSPQVGELEGRTQLEIQDDIHVDNNRSSLTHLGRVTQLDSPVKNYGTSGVFVDSSSGETHKPETRKEAYSLPGDTDTWS